MSVSPWACSVVVIAARDWIRASNSVGLLATKSICNRCEPGSADEMDPRHG